MSVTELKPGPGLFEATGNYGERFVTNVRRIAGNAREPGSVLIASAGFLLFALGMGLLYVSFKAQFAYIFAAKHQNAASVMEALMLDCGMIIFSLLALGLSRAGKSSRTERVLIMVCADASALMNYAAADTASPRSVAAYVAAPVFLAVVVDRVIAVVRRHVLAGDEVSAWSSMGRAVVATARLSGIIMLYSLRTVLAPSATVKGLRRMVLDGAPVPEIGTGHQDQKDGVPRPRCLVRCGLEMGSQCQNLLPCPDHPVFATKKAAFLDAYRKHALYGDRSSASRVAAELAPLVGLQPGTGRTYVGEEMARLEGIVRNSHAIANGEAS